MGYGPSQLLRAEGDLSARRSIRKIMIGLTDSERLLFQKVAEDAVEEAFERQVDLTVADVTVRLLCAYERGIRDEGELKDAVLYNELRVYLH